LYILFYFISSFEMYIPNFGINISDFGMLIPNFATKSFCKDNAFILKNQKYNQQSTKMRIFAALSKE